MQFVFSLLICSILFSQNQKPSVFAKMGQLATQFKLEGRAVTNIVELNDRLYITTEQTLMYSEDAGTNWFVDQSLIDVDSKIGISHAPVKLFKDSKDWLWLTLAVDTTDLLGDSQDAGSGIAFKITGQSNWRLLKQPIDPDNFDVTRIVTPIKSVFQNLSFDIDETYSPTDLVERRIWISSWGGSVRYIYADSLIDSNWQANWIVQTPNGLKLDFTIELNKLQQVAFSLASDRNQLWIGTAYGIYYSNDFGDSFINYSFQEGLNILGQPSITGNFITTLHYNKSSKQIWANSRVTNFGDIGESSAIDIVDFTDENNPTFNSILENEAWAYSFASQGDTVLLGTDNGLYTYNSSLNELSHHLQLIDEINDISLNSKEFFSGYMKDNIIMVGSGDGLARSINAGNDWLIFKSANIKRSVEKEGTVIPVPSPYSPIHSDAEMSFTFPQKQSGQTKISLYNFAMELVHTIEDFRQENNPAIINWNGKDKAGQFVANGVYFIKVITPTDTYWNKLVIVN